MRIGNASLDENKKTHGGKSGDQSKTEVYVRAWQNKPWDTVIRAKDSSLAEKLATYMEQACANDNIGYDQQERNSLLAKLKNNSFNFKTVGKCETDCSALVCTIAIAAGIPESKMVVNGNLRYTGNMEAGFRDTGKFDILKDSKQLTGTDYLKRGDILLNTKSHTAIVLDNGSKVTSSTPAPAPSPSTSTSSFKVGQEVKLKSGAKYADGKSIPSWVFNTKLYVRAINGDKITISTQKTGAITGVVKASSIEGYTAPKASGYSAQVINVKSYLNVRSGPGTSYSVKGRLYNGNKITIIDTKNGWGELSTGGWVSLSYTKKI